MENRPILKDYNTTSFSKNRRKLKFQPMPDCHNKINSKTQRLPENQIFTETINSYFPYKGNAIYKT